MTLSASAEIEPLGPSHDRAAFSCGNADLDEYLKRYAKQDVRRNIGTGSESGAVDKSASTDKTTAIKKKNTTPVIEFPTKRGLKIGASRREVGSTISIIVSRIGSPHSGQSPSAASSLNSYPQRAHGRWSATCI